MNHYKSIGIIGGMGPAATWDLLKKIVEHTDAADDQHHIHTYIDCNVTIPDRTNAILYDAPSPLPSMIESGKKLEQMGADVLIMSCNTAYYYYDELSEALSVPMLNMPRETAKYLNYSGFQRVAVLATDGTVKSGIYTKELNALDIEAIYPKEEHQRLLMSLIYDGIKHGITTKKELPKAELLNILNDLKERGAEAFILACTELPIAFDLMEIDANTIDPTLILAKSAIRYAGAPLKDTPWYP